MLQSWLIAAAALNWAVEGSAVYATVNAVDAVRASLHLLRQSPDDSLRVDKGEPTIDRRKGFRDGQRALPR